HINKYKPDEEQQWQNASANAAMKKLTELAKYFTELISFLESLKNKSNLDESKRKKVKLSNKKSFADFSAQVNPTSINFGAQVNLTFVNFGAQVNPTSVDFGVQVFLPDLIYKSLLGQISKLESANKQLLAKNEELKKRLYERFINQQDRMENEIHEELTNYLSIILEELCVEKNQEMNVIDNLIHNQSQAGCIKKYSVCNTFNINNKKQQSDESSNIVNTNEKSLAINSYTFRESSKQCLAHEVYIPQIYDGEQMLRHDAILEEINKSLKSLIPLIPSQQHWEIAARNCTKFVKLHTNLFNLIEFSENEAHEPRIRSNYISESCRF
ncbi:21005_t:CDS:2, partial [Racocetra persica]